MFGQYKRLRGEFVGVMTGKGFSYGGSLIRPEATGYGCVYFADQMLRHGKEELAEKTCIISGSGNVAQFTASKLLHLGAKVVSFSDSQGAVYDKDGVTSEKLEYLMDLKNKRRGRISDYAKEFKLKFMPNEKPWHIPCEVAFPSATQNEINEADARALLKNGCGAVSEGANMPSTPEAIEIFHDAGIMYGPSKAANAGGVAVSGLEMSQNSLRISWSKEEVDERLHNIMIRIHEQCVEHGSKKNGKVDYVMGANIGGFIKVADAMLAQGLV